MNIQALYLALALLPPPPTVIDGGTPGEINAALVADIKAVEATRHRLYDTALPFRDFIAVYGYEEWPDATYAIRTLYRPRLSMLNREQRRRIDRQHAFAKQTRQPIYRPARHY
jgi:hypothetical protein